MAEASEPPALSTLRKTADIVLKSDSGLNELYELKEELSGAQAGSRRAIEKRTGVTYALSEFLVADLSPGKCEELTAAIAAQRQLADPPAHVSDEVRSARLACLYEVLQSPTRIMLVSELAPTTGELCDDLLSLLQRKGRLKEPDVRSIFARLVLATKRAHDCGAVLRNLKPETVQVRRKEAATGYEVCVADLHCAAVGSRNQPGASAVLRFLAALLLSSKTSFFDSLARQRVPVGEEGGTLTGLHGTPEYAAPEVTIWYWHECSPPRLPEPPPPYGAKADVWALGMCLHVMLCGCFPFKTSVPEEELLRAINGADFKFTDPGWQKLSEEALDLVSQLLQRDPADRPPLEEVLQHPFCTEAMSEVMALELDAASARDERARPLGDLSEAALHAALAELDIDDDD